MDRKFVYRSELLDRLACPRCGSDHVKLYGSKKVGYEEEINGRESLVWDTSVEWDVVYGIECLSCGNDGDADEIFDWKVIRECECGAKITRGNFVEGCDEGYEVEEVYECPKRHKRIQVRIVRGRV